MESSDWLDTICAKASHVNSDTLKEVITLGVELAREGREGRKVGTIFTVGDAAEVLTQSRSLILDPVKGHPPAMRRIEDMNVRETIKELSQLDGAFVISDDGVLISAARYLNSSWEDLDLPLGLGSRHMAGASISKRTSAVAVVVSESSVVRIFVDGELVTEILPELWMMDRFHSSIASPESIGDDHVAVLSQRE